MRDDPFPIRILGLALENFRGWHGRHEIALDGDLTVVVGDNGSGKSSLLNAIEWCLFGGEVAKKGSGIDERAEWEIAHRGARGPVEVALTFAVEDGSARFVRRREAGAKVRDPDSVRIELPEGDVLGGDEIGDWLEWNGMPDWSTWKHAFCAHQEHLRGRVLDTGERSVQLAGLLGLGEFAELSGRLKGLGAAKLAKAAEAELALIEGDLLRLLGAPERESEELTQRLEQRGYARTQVDEPLILEVAETLRAEGARVAGGLGLEEPAPDPGAAGADDVLAWALGWEPKVNARRGELERGVTALRLDLQQLEGTAAGIEPAQRRWQDASSARSTWIATHGSSEELERQVRQLQEERERLRAEAANRDARRELLRQAWQVIEGTGDGNCPVCGHGDSSLGESLRLELEREDDPLRESLDQLDVREMHLLGQRTELGRLQADFEVADGALVALRRDLEAQVSGSAEEQLRAWRSQLARQEALLRGLDEHLAAHRKQSEVLELLLKWRAARARAGVAASDLTQLEAWNSLQDAIDEAAGLAVDLEVLGGMAREAQEERSSERVAAVNRTLGKYYGRICSDRPGDAVRLEVKTTATRLSYRLIDGAGKNVTPVLNQAALNALSFALLFAQAEDRARRGLPSWLILDDPGQSLDGTHLEGLAAAVAELAEHLPVLLASYPGALCETLARLRPDQGRLFRIVTSPGGSGTRLEETHR